MATQQSMLFPGAMSRGCQTFGGSTSCSANCRTRGWSRPWGPGGPRGRDEYPVRAMWWPLVARVVLGHGSLASLLRELGRNPALLSACGFDPLGRQSAPRRVLARSADGRVAPALEARPRRDGVPTAWVFSRFLSNVVALAEGLDGLFGAEPGLAARCADFVADRGLDSGPPQERLWDRHRILGWWTCGRCGARRRASRP